MTHKNLKKYIFLKHFLEFLFYLPFLFSYLKNNIKIIVYCFLKNILFLFLNNTLSTYTFLNIKLFFSTQKFN